MKRLRWLLPLLVVACGDPGAPKGDVTALLGSAPATGLLQCAPLPYDSTTQTIGPDGGTIQAGPHSLVIPAGALVEPTPITAVVTPGPVNAVRFGPEGLRFDRPAALTMSYANCDLLGSLLPKRIAYTSSAHEIIDYLPSADDLFGRRVTAALQHFSDYAVAW
jgi:hypothetical protein